MYLINPLTFQVCFLKSVAKKTARVQITFVFKSNTAIAGKFYFVERKNYEFSAPDSNCE